MTDKQKQTIRAMRRQGLPYRTIADSLALTYNTVKSFCYRENLGNNSQMNEQTGKRGFCKYCGRALKSLQGSKPKIFCDDKCRYSWWNKNRKYYKRIAPCGEGLP